MVPSVGEKIPTWFGDNGVSTIIEVKPYTGKYPQWFRYIIRVTAPRTRRGWLEMAV